jgi:TetR/AcrR family transcriptional regulator, lmrAB and yxaGH operons repressor
MTIIIVKEVTVAGEVRARMVATAVRLLARGGLRAASFSGVVGASGAPRGSIYHHFPDGKDQLVAAALDLAGDHALALLAADAGQPADAIAEHFLSMWRELLTRSDFQAGCAVLAVSVETDSPPLQQQTAAIFRAWRTRLAALLEQGGLRPGPAARFAALLVASSEGAVVLSRAEQSIEPFDLVAEQLLAEIRAAVGSPQPR